MGNAFSCKICLTKRPTRKRFKNYNGCKHPFCKDCIAKYIISKVDDDTPDIECPESGCEARLNPSSCKLLISKPVYARWRNLIRQFNQDLDDPRVCKMMNPDVDVNFALTIASRKIQRCPKCKIFVERILGCKIIKCRCGAEFCYECGCSTKSHVHPTSGPCVRKDKILFRK